MLDNKEIITQLNNEIKRLFDIKEKIIDIQMIDNNNIILITKDENNSKWLRAYKYYDRVNVLVSNGLLLL